MSSLQSSEYRAKHAQELQVYQKKIELITKKLKSMRDIYEKEVKILKNEVQNLRTQESSLIRFEKEYQKMSQQYRDLLAKGVFVEGHERLIS